MKLEINDGHLKKMSSYAPFLLFFAYCFSVVRVYYYYRLYDFDIFPYITFTEILPQAASDIFFTISVSILAFIFWRGVGIISKLFHKKTLSTAVEPGAPGQTLGDNAIKVILLIGVICFTVVLVLLVNGVLFYNNLRVFYHNLQGLLTWIIIIFMAVVAFKLVRPVEQEDHKNITTMILILLLGFVTILAIQKATDTCINTRFYHSTVGTTIQMENETVHSTKTNYYIGRTNNYIIFFDEKQDGVVVYPASEVKKIIHKDIL